MRATTITSTTMVTAAMLMSTTVVATRSARRQADIDIWSVISGRARANARSARDMAYPVLRVRGRSVLDTPGGPAFLAEGSDIECTKSPRLQ